MQMGPALLPTPLSPARGHPVPCETSGGPSASLVAAHTWRPMSDPVRPILRLVSCDWRIRVSSPALAPASGFRSCPAAIIRSPKTPVSRCHAQLPGRDRVPLPIRACGISGLRHPCHPFRPDYPACPAKQRRALLKRSTLHLAKASSKPSLDERVGLPRRHPWELNHQNFKALRLSVPVDPCPEDKLKLRLNRRSGNICKSDFSTFARIRCGHGWISQRPVAFVMVGRRERAKNRLKIVMQASARRIATAATRQRLRAQASRLRRASKRSRRPFSLMKPSASF